MYHETFINLSFFFFFPLVLFIISLLRTYAPMLSIVMIFLYIVNDIFVYRKVPTTYNEDEKNVRRRKEECCCLIIIQ